MKKIRNLFFAALALAGLAMGSAQAAPLNIDTINVDLDLTVGAFSMDWSCDNEFDCTFTSVDDSGDWFMAGGAEDGNFGFMDFFDFDHPVGFGPLGNFDFGLDNGDFMLIDLVEFGGNGSNVFEFYGEIAGGGGAIHSDFLSFGNTVGIVIVGGDDQGWFADIVNVRETDVPEPSTLLLLGLGLAGFGLSRRRKLR